MVSSPLIILSRKASPFESGPYNEKGATGVEDTRQSVELAVLKRNFLLGLSHICSSEIISIRSDNQNGPTSLTIQMAKKVLQTVPTAERHPTCIIHNSGCLVDENHTWIRVGDMQMLGDTVHHRATDFTHAGV